MALSLIAFDTSHYIKMSEDFVSNHSECKQRVKKTLGQLFNRNTIPLITHHQLVELIAVEDDSKVQNRITLLQNLPKLAWIKPFTDNLTFGSIVDLQTAEANIIFNSPSLQPMQVVDLVKQSIFTTDSGYNAISAILEFLPILRQHQIDNAHRHREIVSIKNAQSFGEIGEVKIGSIINNSFRNQKELGAVFSAMKESLKGDLRTSGDERLENPDSIAHSFLSDIFSKLQFPPVSSQTPVEILLQTLGLDIADLSLEMTVNDVGELKEFLSKLKVINQYLNLDFDELKSKVSPGSLPSGIVKGIFEKYSQTPVRHKGSDLNDSYLLSFSPYVDIVCVDKRTHNNFMRAKQKSTKFSSLANSVVKGSYFQICNGLK